MVNKKLESLLEEVLRKRATLSKEADVHTPVLSNKDIENGQTAEEVKAPLIENEEIPSEEEIEEASEEVEEEIADEGELDYEGDMAANQLKTIIDAAMELHRMMVDNEDANLPEWVQSKITLAKEYIDTARDYLKAEVTEAVGEEFSKEEVEAVMESLNLDTSKYTFEYLAEAIGFKKKKKAAGHTPKITKDQVHKSKGGKDLKAPLIENEELGSAAAEPVATSSEQPEEHTPTAGKEDIHTSQSAEEVKAPLIEAAKAKKHLKVKIQPKKNVVLGSKGELKQGDKSITPSQAILTKKVK